ncbi:MAG: cytochrome C [Gallionellaceae bacterium]|jgi:cytochrome c|nr:cytochrome C [Gallionellaceae bacterium]
MKKIIVSMMAAAGLMIAGSAAADTPMPTDLISAGKFACTGCHKVDSKLVGPAWRDVSKFYNGKTAATSEGVSLKDATGGKSAKDYLIEKVSKGGKGHWGKTPMSPNDPSGAKKAEVAALVDWILALEI